MEPGRRGRAVPKLESSFLNPFSLGNVVVVPTLAWLVPRDSHNCPKPQTRAGPVPLSPSLGSSWLCDKGGEIPELKTHRELTGTACPEPLRALPAWEGGQRWPVQAFPRTAGLGTWLLCAARCPRASSGSSQGHPSAVPGQPGAQAVAAEGVAVAVSSEPGWARGRVVFTRENTEPTASNNTNAGIKISRGLRARP